MIELKPRFNNLIGGMNCEGRESKLVQLEIVNLSENRNHKVTLIMYPSCTRKFCVAS